jgi:hypothetical protein
MTPREKAETIITTVLIRGREGYDGSVEFIERVIAVAIAEEREACARAAENASENNLRMAAANIRARRDAASTDAATHEVARKNG